MKKLSLTFDDGPDPINTLDVLEVLDRHKVPATFFVIEERSLKYPNTVKCAEIAGHVIANHSLTHSDLCGATFEQLEKEINGWGQYFRPPGGHYDTGLLKYLELYSIQFVLWDADGFDYIPGRTAEQIVQTLDEQIAGTDGGIILLHDSDSRDQNANRSATVEAIDRLIQRYKAEGYEFVPLDQMTLPGVPRKTVL